MQYIMKWATGMTLAVASLTSAYSQTITIVAPFSPGGAVDRLARVLAQELSEQEGYTVVVENKPGAGAQVAMNTIKASKPDGTTLFLGDSSAYSLNRHMYSNLNYDADTDLQPISLLGEAPVFLLVPDASPIKSTQDLVDLAKTQNLTYGSPGVGTGTHVVGEILAKQTQVTTTHVPYKGAAPALMDLVAGRVDFMFDVLVGSHAFLKDGRIRAVALASPERSDLLPDVPTIKEAGIDDVNFIIWWGIAAKGGTPAPTIEKLNTAITKAMAKPVIIQQFKDIGINIKTDTPQQFAALIKQDAETYRDVIKSLNIKLD